MATPPVNNPPSTGQIDLGQLAQNNHRYELSLSNNETEQDGSARRALEAAAAAHQRRIQFAVVLFAMAVSSVVFAGCVFAFVTGTPDDKKWAAGILGSIASGLIGFLVGQGSKK
ncbi:MAG: hypothetical protein RL748_4122 [Pseudomonadota bacterium]|jgi:hypothetical protein